MCLIVRYSFDSVMNPRAHLDASREQLLRTARRVYARLARHVVVDAPPTEDDRRRAEELARERGWDRVPKK
jgi:hypothetical protein